MIQPPTLIPASLIALSGEAAPALNGEAAQGADFGALLAISAAPPAAVDEAVGPAPAVALPAAALAPEPAVPANSGKVLPLALPLAPLQLPSSTAELAPTTLPAAAPDETAAASKPSLAEPATEPVATPKSQRAAHKQIAGTPGAPAAPSAPKLAVAVAAEPEETAAPVAQVPVEPIAAQSQPLSPISPSPQFALPQASPAPSDASPHLIQSDGPPATHQQPALAAFEHAAPQAAFLRTLAPPAEPQPVPDQPAASAPSAPNRPLRIEIALPPQLAAATRTASPVALRQRAAAEHESIAAPLFAAASPAPPARLPAAAQSAPLGRPQDFTALLDRLVAARDAAAPQRVSVTLPHAEFGPVHLRFRQEDGALAVTMTSADPDFARAAAQAPPPVLPTSESRAAPGSASHSDTSGAAANAGSGQPRGQLAERRAEQTGRDNPSPRAAGQAKPERRHGIFA